MADAAVAAVPKRAGLVLSALILGALVANLNLSVANIALPDIGRAFNATQTQINLIALGCTLGLAMSVLYLGALGDRYGRKLMLVLGMVLTVPASFLSAFAPNASVLVLARLFTGVAAGLAFPTTLALITALWGPGKARLKGIALWSGISAGGAILGPVIAGALLEKFWWGSVFLIAVPPAVVALVLVVMFVPAHVNESRESVDHLGGVLSVIMIAALVYGIGTVSAVIGRDFALTCLALALVTGGLFVWRQLTAANPLYDLHYARRRLFWVPAVAGMIVFGSLMGAMFIGQQFLQNVLDYSPLEAGLAILPSAFAMMLVSPVSARVVDRLGSAVTLLIGYALIFPAFIIMLIVWGEDTSYWWVGLCYLLIGLGAGLALTPASRSLTSSVPVTRVGMASATTDLQRDLGGSIMQALLGTLLTAGYAAAFVKAITSAESTQSIQVSQSTQATLTMSYSSAENLAATYPDYQAQIIAAARESFLTGANWAYTAAALAVLAGAVLVAVGFPRKRAENELIQRYQSADAQQGN